MKKYSIIVGIVAFVLAIASAFDSPNDPPVEVVASYYLHSIEEFQKETEHFAELVKQQPTSEQLVSAFENLRITFKRVEFLVSYSDPEWVTNFFNGAPLPHLEPKTSGINVLEPEGLQRMEELVYEEDVEFSVLRRKAKTLQQQAKLLKDFSRYHHFSDREIFEAVRFQIIRVLSQGITGFDTPASDRAIVESAISLGAARDAMALYMAPLEQADKEFTFEFITTWNYAIDYLEENPDFESFGRAEFIRNYLEPLFGMTLTAQGLLNVEFKEETTTMVQSINHHSRHIFSSDLINPFYYTQMRENQYTPATVELGRALFFDPILSENVERSCGSCHKPHLAFTDGLPKSTALQFDGTVDRNAPTLVNAALSPRYFYDLRTERLETQFDHVIFNPKEFNMSYTKIVDRLKLSSEYAQMFKAAYGERSEVSKRNIETAIASYIVSLSAFNSPVDRWLRGEEEVSEEVEKGFDLFMGKAACGTCHFAPTFAGLVPPYFQDMETEVLGVPSDSSNTVLDPDLGRAAGIMKEQSEIYNHSFKTVTVRNVKLTGPYMHNGVYTNLQQVVDFYSEGGGAGHGLEVPNQTLPFDSLELSEEEKSFLIAFMEALTDLPENGYAPENLPSFENHPEWNDRRVGGTY